MSARLKEYYNSEIVPAMVKKFGYKNIMEVPKLDKIVVNMGVGEAKENAKLLDAAVKEMETKGYLRKISSPDDGRVTYISITEEGRKLSQKYNEYYFGELVPYLSEISEEEADCMIRTIEKFYQIMCERRNHYDK